MRTHVAFTSSEADSRNIDEPTSDLMGGLGSLLSAKALHREAEAFKQCALVIDKRHFGPDSTQVAIRLNNLSTTLWATNPLSEAEPLLTRVVNIFEKSYGENHPNVATALNNLAQLLQATNRLSEAEPLMSEAMMIFSRSLGNDHPNTQTVKRNSQMLLQEMGLSEDEAHAKIQAHLRGGSQ